MAKKKRKNQTQKKTSIPIEYDSNPDLNNALNTIARKRTGGAINIRGIGFQLLYSCNKIVKELQSGTIEKSIRLEGIEDLDIIHIDNNEYFQLKSSINDLDAGAFWKLRIMQNFLDTYKVNPKTKLHLVHNSNISKGRLLELSKKKVSKESLSFWKEKFEKSSIDITSIDFEEFLCTIHFEKVSESDLIEETLKLLIDRFSLNKGTEQQYLKALFFNVFSWSKQRAEVTHRDLQLLIQVVTDSFSKAPVNPAIQYNWIEKVSFKVSDNSSEIGYFDGKAARPVHIAANLPVPRKDWEKIIDNGIRKFDVTVIKSSSGQGKSSLAWRCAKACQDTGFSIYELNHCSEWNNVAGISDFIESRLNIGECPLLVVDGLNGNISYWNKLVEKISDLPVKLLVTTREEDWYRYGLDASICRLQIVDIRLSKQEAKEIFNQLKRKGRVHSNINQWQPIWEKIETKGLLIEYVYLLTQGEMIEERLYAQVKELNKESDAAAKIEILRLIALSDILNINIKSQLLTTYVHEKIGFTSDRGEMYKQLEREYYIRLDQEYIEGLHPVRSRHLVNVLHQTVFIEDSLKTLFKIIEEKFIYDYFISVSSLINKEKKHVFYQALAQLTSSLKFSEMVYAIDGLMHSEPYRYWIENKKIFDEVFERGGLEIFIGDTLPFTKLNTINELQKSMDEKSSNFQVLSEKLMELTPYEISNSDLVSFARSLAENIQKRKKVTDRYEGIGYLIKWFKQLNISFPLMLELNEIELIEILENRDINESSEVCNYFAISNPKVYSGFIKKNISKIISILKKETDSLTIEERGKDIHINYLLDNDADKVNELSIYRIQTVYNILPNYEHYCTKVIILPFPNEDIYKTIVQGSTKKISKENIGDTFDVHINQIWNRTILDNYRASSSFEWQNQFLQLRKDSLEFSKKCIRYFEARIEDNASRIQSSIKPLLEKAQSVSKLLKIRKKYPAKSKKYFEIEPYKTEQTTIDQWCFSLNNFINQFVRIVQPKTDNDRNLAMINLKNVVYKLYPMQEAFNYVSANFDYFSVDQLTLNEKDWYDRLLKTISYFIYQVENSKKKSILAKKTVNDWWRSYHDKELSHIHSIIKKFEEESYFFFHLPNRIIENGILRTLVVGVDQLDITTLDEDLFDLLSGLIELQDTNIDFFSFVNINATEAIGAFRVHNDFIKRVKNYIETGELEESEFGNPIPINVDEELIDSLDGISISKIQINGGNESFTNMMFGIWKLSEYRNRLDRNIEIEKNWLEEIEKEYGDEIRQHIDETEQVLNPEEFIELKQFVNHFLSSGDGLSKDEIITHLNNRMQSINEKYQKE